MHSLPQDIVSERDSDHKTSKQDQYVDFNVLEKKKSKMPVNKVHLHN